ncbi:MAG: hypothetical protein CMP34_04480 [Rickettsiales bacterium]|nr:hypothetical protein [Rickettsiales bacterium]|tara:strand:+ start:297 stop:722 length:426 start_codon:yes stop_codon:yes gene_type:complete
MYLKKIFFLLFISILINSCAGDKLVPIKGPDGDPGTELNFAQFDDIPIPMGSKLIKDDSIIISKQNGWLGRLVFDNGDNQLEIFDFFRNELPKFGWKKLSEIRSERSLLNYSNNSRLASIQIIDNTFFGSMVTITVTELDN